MDKEFEDYWNLHQRHLILTHIAVTRHVTP